MREKTCRKCAYFEMDAEKAAWFKANGMHLNIGSCQYEPPPGLRYAYRQDQTETGMDDSCSEWEARK